MICCPIILVNDFHNEMLLTLVSVHAGFYLIYGGVHVKWWWRWWWWWWSKEFLYWDGIWLQLNVLKLLLFFENSKKCQRYGTLKFLVSFVFSAFHIYAIFLFSKSIWCDFSILPKRTRYTELQPNPIPIRKFLSSLDMHVLHLIPMDPKKICNSRWQIENTQHQNYHFFRRLLGMSNENSQYKFDNLRRKKTYSFRKLYKRIVNFHLEWRTFYLSPWVAYFHLGHPSIYSSPGDVGNILVRLFCNLFKKTNFFK